MDGIENLKKRGIGMLAKINQLINNPIIAFMLGYGIGLVNALLMLSK